MEFEGLEFIALSQSDEHLPAADVLQLLGWIVETRNEPAGERGVAVQVGQIADRMTFQSRLLRAVRHQRPLADDNHLPPRADFGQGLGQIVGKLNADGLLDGRLQARPKFAVIPLGVPLHTRTG